MIQTLRKKNMMMPKVVTSLCFIVILLTTTGSSCVNDSVLVAVKLNPVVARFRIGTTPGFFASVTFQLDSLIPSEYKNKLKQGRIYDLKVKVEGEYSGRIASVATIRVGGNIENSELVRFPDSGTVPWSAFYAAQSLLGNSPYIVPQREGIEQLLRALTTTPLPPVTVSTFGALTGEPIPEGLYVTVEVYLQADAELN